MSSSGRKNTREHWNKGKHIAHTRAGRLSKAEGGFVGIRRLKKHRLHSDYTNEPDALSHSKAALTECRDLRRLSITSAYIASCRRVNATARATLARIFHSYCAATGFGRCEWFFAVMRCC